MSFPFSYTNKIEVKFDEEKHTPENLMKNVLKSLQKVRAKNIKNDQNHISFTGGIFRLAMNWNILGPISSGEIAIEKNNGYLTLKYHLKFTEMLILVTAMVIGFLGIGIYRVPNLTFFHRVLILIFAWFWLFGMNYLIMILRFPGFIREMAEIK